MRTRFTRPPGARPRRPVRRPFIVDRGALSETRPPEAPLGSPARAPPLVSPALAPPVEAPAVAGSAAAGAASVIATARAVGARRLCERTESICSIGADGVS
jgi:hypothetical protein